VTGLFEDDGTYDKQEDGDEELGSDKDLFQAYAVGFFLYELLFECGYGVE
jgi:hypothetical protein